MKHLPLLLLIGFHRLAWGQLEFVPDSEPSVVFAGAPQTIRVLVRNPGGQEVEMDASVRVLQVASRVLAPVGAAQPWKRLRVAAGQTLVEHLSFTLPAVRAPTQFRLSCSGIGHIAVLGQPTDVLKRLGALAGESPLAVADPGEHLLPALRAAGLPAIVEGASDVQDSRLALVWTDRGGLPEAIRARLVKGMAVVWICPAKVDAVVITRVGEGVLVVVPHGLLAGLKDSAGAQAALVQYAAWALTPDRLSVDLTHPQENP